MIDLKEIENWERIGWQVFYISLKQISQPFGRDDDQWCGYRWFFVVQTLNNKTWLLNIVLRSVQDGIPEKENISLLTEEFHFNTSSKNRKSAMRKAHNIVKSMGLV